MRHRRPVAPAERGVFGREDVALVTATEAAELDRSAREAYGVPERVLMENAGRAAATVLQRLHPRGRVAIVAGGGNNGGDGLVVARVLRAWGRDAVVIAGAPRPPDSALLHGFDLAVHDSTDIDALLGHCDIVVDALLGTGTRGAPRAPAAALIDAMNAADRPVLSLDLPSGVDATTGRVDGAAVRAHATITFGWPKLGLMFQPARDCCGRLIAVEIGFPPIGESDARAAVITPAWARARLPVRRPDSHKGDSGRLVVFAGSEGMAGAAALAAIAARRAGAGLVRIASDSANREILQTLVPEALFSDRATLDADGLAGTTAVVAGPGIGAQDGVRPLLDAVLAHTGECPVLLDADALNLLAHEPAALERLGGGRPVVITPHPKEMARLMGATLDEIVADAPAAARAAADRFRCVALLKGQPTVIAAPGKPLLVTSVGSSDVATAGMGDQLSGTIGGMLAAGLDARTAAAVGLFYSGRAADLAALGRSLGPRDVADFLPAAFADPGPRGGLAGLPFVTFDQPPRR